jgi:prostatic aicd phosphatase
MRIGFARLTVDKMKSLIPLVFFMTSTVSAHSIHSVVVFTRHGDRTAKFYNGYHMTNLGSNQIFDSGSFYRDRYIADGSLNQINGVSPNQVVASEVWASAPDQDILFQTATNFLQGLYPPLNQINPEAAAETLVNGTEISDPLDGYQYILIHGEGSTDPDTIWIKGDDECPAYTKSYKSYAQTPSYNATLASSAETYDSVVPLLGHIMGDTNVSYSHAYDVFDLLNVASIHNASVAPSIEPDTLDTVRYLANEWEWNNNYNASEPIRSIGGMALSGRILERLNASVSSSGESNKFNLLAGSYDTFLAFFGITNLTSASPSFMGLPNYAATMAFELYSEAPDFPSNIDDDLFVRFLFRNGSESSEELTAYPLFGQESLVMSYGAFVEQLSARAVSSVGEWCSMCGSTADFCVAANQTTELPSSSSSSTSSESSSSSGLSNAAAGGIGAAVTLAVLALGGAVFWLVRRRRGARGSSEAFAAAEKTLSRNESESGSDGSLNRQQVAASNV